MTQTRWTTGGAAAIGLAAAIWAMPATAADADGSYAIRGIGALTCGAFLDIMATVVRTAEADGARPEGSADAITRFIAIEGWIDGYVSAHNRFTPNVYDAAPMFTTPDVVGILAKGCPANPDLAVAAAMPSILSGLAGASVTTRPTMITVGEGEQARQVPQEIVRSAQRALNARGLYQSGIDGVFGPGTQSGLRSFQEAEGLGVTGTLDQATIARLLLPASPGASAAAPAEPVPASQ